MKQPTVTPSSPNGVPAGFRLRLARIRSSHYEWFGNPRADCDHSSELEFPPSARRGKGDKDASLSWALTPVMDALNGKFTQRHHNRNAYRRDMNVHAEAMEEQAGIAPEYLAIIVKLDVYMARRERLRLWWNVPDHHEAPHALVPEEVGDEELRETVGTWDRTTRQAQVRWWVQKEYTHLDAEFRRMEIIKTKYERYVQLTKHEPCPPDNDMDDREWVEDKAGYNDTFEVFRVLEEHFPALLRSHIPVWAVVEGSDGRGELAWDAYGIPESRDGLWWLRAELLRAEQPSMFTPTGRPKKGVFRRWNGDAKRSFEGHLKAMMDAEMSEYAAWADNTAVETELQVMPDEYSALVAPKFTPGMIDADEELIELFGGTDHDDNFDPGTGPWYRTGHDRDFDAVSMVKDALPGCMFGDGEFYFPSGYAIADYLTKEWQFGYADDPGTWHYVAFLEPLPNGGQYEMPGV